ncbi:MAG: GNAT family N-acetyltransferase [Anaerolineae bacterium]
MTSSKFIALSAHTFSFEQLADIYNESRVDYIVPMPMNAKRLAEYVHQYDVDLSASVVAVNADHQVAGVGMLGLRGQRAWITRLGVIPTRRGRGIGQAIMEALLHNAVERGCTQVQLEVIEGNEPAYDLFVKLGFSPTRRLLVIRRAPGSTGQLPFSISSQPLQASEILDCLHHRTDMPSWLDETPSILYNGGAQGLSVSTSDGAMGWIVLRPTVFQLSHFVLGTDAGDLSHDLALSLLTAVHTTFNRRDTKIENIPADSALIPIFESLNYAHEFARIEMSSPL